VIKAITVREEDEVMVITSMGKTIKLNVSAVRQMGKAARGVRIVNIDPPDLVIGMDKIVQQVELEGSAPNLVPELK
jgi:DNA gyrase subunit A